MNADRRRLLQSLIIRWACVAAALALAACGRDAAHEAAAVMVDTLAGGAVRIVNPAEGLWDADSTARWRVVQMLRIGRVEGTGPDVFGKVGSVLVDDLDRIWVVDELANQLQVFDRDGRFIRTVGRKGSGPGEFRRVGRAFPGPGGEIWVEDLSLSRWEVFDTTGTRISGYRFGSSLPGGWHVWTRDGRFLVMHARPDAPDAAPVLVAYRRGSTGVLVAEDTLTLPAPPEMPQIITYASPDGRYRMRRPVPFAPLPWGTLGREGDLWLSDGDGSYEIRRQTVEGDTLLIIRRTHKPVAIPDSVRERAFDDLVEWFSSRIPGGVQRADLDPGRTPRVYPPFDEYFVATDGTLWVRRTVDAGIIGFDVFGRDGRYLGEAAVPADVGSMRIQLITTSDVYAVATDSLGVDQVVRLEIRRPPAGVARRLGLRPVHATE